MENGQAPSGFSKLRKEFWERVERAAGSRKAMLLRLQLAGHRASLQSVGGWVRGEVDPGFDVSLLASVVFGVSLDALCFGVSLDEDAAEQLRRHDQEMTRLGDRVAWLTDALERLAEHVGGEAILDERPMIAETASSGNRSSAASD